MELFRDQFLLHSEKPSHNKNPLTVHQKPDPQFPGMRPGCVLWTWIIPLSILARLAYSAVKYKNR